MSATCSIEGCIRPRATRGWCKPHYRRWQRHGTPLGGGVSPGSLPKWVEEVALNYENDDCLPWPFGDDGKGYGSIEVAGKTMKASRYLCMKAHGPPTASGKMFAAHSCGNGHLGCMNKKHIRWATPAENTQDSIEHGTFVRGEKSVHAKLSWPDVLSIREMVKANSATRGQIAKLFGISKGHVWKVASGFKWSHISERGSHES